MRSFEITKNIAALNSEINKNFKFKVYLTSHGPGFHSEFKFSIKSKFSNKDERKIYLSVRNNIISFHEKKESIIFKESEFLIMLQTPFEKGIQRFVDYLALEKLNISTDLEIEIFEYFFHVVDSKPIANELGLEMALMDVFKSQLNFVQVRHHTLEELI